jgi:serine/threonine-protein kinase
MSAEDRYQVVRELGRGGMGIVYLANDTWLKREVAIKTVKAPEGEDTEEWRGAIKRLIREAQAAAGLDHPGIVPIYDVIPDGRSPSIIMKYVRGKTLADAAPLGVPANPSFALRALKECASALDYAHSLRRVHRDFKPANVILDNAGCAIIMDFGIVKLLDSPTDLTHGNVIGTCQYMSPEQMNAAPVDGRSDQYSLAVVAYQLLTGCRVFDATDLGSFCTMILFQDPPPASERHPGLPKAVDSVLGKALTKKAAERYASCMEFVTELEAAIVKTRPQPSDVRVNEIDGQRYRWIPPGTFQMGCSEGDKECDASERPAHEVTISRGFWMGETPVTVGAYKRYAQAKGPPVPSDGDDALPIVSVTWDEAASYCKWAGGRLPTEAEWEYAARAGAPGARHGNLDDVAWCGSNSGSGPKPVGQKQPNAFDLFDTLGNVWEWTADWYSLEYYEASEKQDPQGPPKGTMRTLRGGSWGHYPLNARVSCRGGHVPGRRLGDVGFRCLMDADAV